MLACDTSVTTAWACANVNRAPCAASPSRLGVGARPPYDPSASARSVSIVTRRTLRSVFGASENERPPLHESTAAAAAKRITEDQEIRRPGANRGRSKNPVCLLISWSPDLL